VLKKLLVLFLIFINLTVYAEKDVITHVLDSDSSFQLIGSNNWNREQLNYFLGISDDLIDIILKDPNNDRAWSALHKFRTFTDAGATQIFHDACFRALKRNPLIFFNRYMAGDDEAVKRAIDAAWGFSEVDTQSSNSEDMVFLYKNLAQIQAKAGRGKRQNIFVDKFSEAINDRKIEVSQ